MKLAPIITTLSLVLTTNTSAESKNPNRLINQLIYHYKESCHYTEEIQKRELLNYLQEYEQLAQQDFPRIRFKREVNLDKKFSSVTKETYTLQKFLKANYFLLKDYEIQGIYDKETEEAVKKFQLENNIPTTGKVDERTLAKLWFLPLSHELKRNPKITKETLEMILNVQERLATEGYQDCAIGILDQNTINAIHLYKRLNNLHDTNKIDREFVYHISMSYKEKSRRIKEAIKAYSQFHIRKTGPHIVINIPEFKARFYYNGILVQEQRAILGKYPNNGPDKYEWATKVQSDEITWIIINPPWRVPKSIQALMQNPLTIIRPGPTNPLGKAAFRLRYAIHGQILHGTPNKRLFNKSKRNFSHGCIRLENIVETIKIFNNLGLLRTKTLKRKLRKKRTTYRLKPKQNIPVDMVYIRASVIKHNGKKYLSLPDDVYKLRSSQIPNKKNKWRVRKIRAR